MSEYINTSYPIGFRFCDCEKEQELCDRDCLKKQIMDEAFHKHATGMRRRAARNR